MGKHEWSPTLNVLFPPTRVEQDHLQISFHWNVTDDRMYIVSYNWRENKRAKKNKKNVPMIKDSSSLTNEKLHGNKKIKKRYINDGKVWMKPYIECTLSTDQSTRRPLANLFPFKCHKLGSVNSFLSQMRNRTGQKIKKGARAKGQ